VTDRTTHVEPHHLHARLHDDAVVVDVRTPGEFESSHIPHAWNLPLDRLDQHVDDIRETAEADGELVLVCRSGGRAREAQQRLREAGIEAAVLEGGMNAWHRTDAPVVRDVLRWDLERQVRLAAGSLVLLSVLAGLAWTPAVAVAGFVGAGLVFSAVTDTCGMALLLSRLPYNRPAGDAGGS
jgi:rhodanese-related sulfurtransferase